MMYIIYHIYIIYITHTYMIYDIRYIYVIYILLECKRSFVSWNPLILDVEPGTSGTMRSVLAVRHTHIPQSPQI